MGVEMPATAGTLLKSDCLRTWGHRPAGRKWWGRGAVVLNPDGFTSLGRRQQLELEAVDLEGFSRWQSLEFSFGLLHAPGHLKRRVSTKH